MFNLFARQYHYVGPEDILSLVRPDHGGSVILSRQQLEQWLRWKQEEFHQDEIIATFIIDTRGRLLLAERQSEHVVCANGKPVLSAGEMEFQLDKDRVEVVAVSNQSTGYCPEVKSWRYVAKALKKLGLNVADGFTSEFEFRRCQQCQNINLVKDEWYVCAFCEQDLSRTWNLA